MLGLNISVTVPLAKGKVKVRPAKVTVRLALAVLTILAKGQKSITLPLLATLLVDEERKVFVDLMVPEAQVTMAEVTVHHHPVMMAPRTLLHPEGLEDRLAMFGILVQVRSQASSGVVDRYQRHQRLTLMRSSQ